MMLAYMLNPNRCSLTTADASRGGSALPCGLVDGI